MIGGKLGWRWEERQRHGPFICWMLLQMPVAARSWVRLKLEPGDSNEVSYMGGRNPTIWDIACFSYPNP